MKKTRIARIKTPRVGSVAKECTEVSTPERTRNVPISDSEKHKMASRMVQTLSASRFSITTAECKKRGARDPRHQRRILDRVPEPPSAPAEFVIGPVRAHGDAERHEDPGREHPRPHIARPGRIDAAFDQRRDGKRKRNREADIAEIKKRRMNREPDILQQRIEVAPLGRRVGEAQERIRADENKEIKRRRDPGLNAERVGAQARRQIASEASRPSRRTR